MQPEQVRVEDVSLKCFDGLTIAAQRWTMGDAEIPRSQRILCIHGWLDNCRSFYHLAPYLVRNLGDSEQVDVVAIELPGHGKSSHKSRDGPIVVLSEFAYYVAEAVEKLGWSRAKYSLIGHSLGASVSSVYAAAFPEQISCLIMLESLGPRAAEDASNFANDVRSHVKRRMMSNKPSKSKLSTGAAYPDLETAVETRQATAAAFPGAQYISKESSRELVLRATKAVDKRPKEVVFTHDSRLRWPSLQYMTKEQVGGLLSALNSCRTCILLAKDGMPYSDEMKDEIQSLMSPAVFKTLPGSHHFHMDTDDADKVGEIVVEFVRDTPLNI